ncbi:MAG: hypothetical protein AVDCRST_MAG34-194 [uncultured Nocardioidaceae bacterium]|uniref:Sulfotransferase n=1 Tax=uncultured Nocardioidaceae bacterium TaxID=253824 RepID=A0A6J4LE07_9ACTN|nr:MAG: hypothetical protein AVDCRST_MAG34-194 [uncultured Nocardioidaceae bacterium]
MTVPTFLVIGGARCGTTGLVEGLRRHPRVFLTEPKEPHYFALHRIGANFTAPGDAHTINQVSVTDRDAYLALYDAAGAAGASYLARGDGSVSTMYYYQEAIPEILSVNPDMKLVMLLREPVDRAFSAYGYMRARGLEPVEDFLAAVALEDERREAGWHHIWHYTRMSRYADALTALQAQLPDDQLGVWFYDELDTDYEGTVGQVLEFLGVPPLHDGVAEVPRVNVSGEPRSALVHKGIAWATGNPAVRTALKSMTSYRLREAVRRRVVQSNGVPGAAREQLAPLFTEDLARLRELLPGRGPAWIQGVTTP